jgi:hypothetical protein
MPLPTDPLTADEIETTRDASGESSLSTITQLATALTEEQRVTLRDYIAKWQQVRMKTTTLSGGRLGLTTSPEETRRLVRDAVRSLLGLPPWEAAHQLAEDSTYSGGTSGAIPNWFIF